MIAPPSAPVVTLAATATSATRERVAIAWADVTTETRYTVQWSATAGTPLTGTAGAPQNATSYTITGLPRRGWWIRVGAVNPVATTWSAWTFVATA